MMLVKGIYDERYDIPEEFKPEIHPLNYATDA